MSFELALPCHLPDPGVLPTKNIVTVILLNITMILYKSSIV